MHQNGLEIRDIHTINKPVQLFAEFFDHRLHHGFRCLFCGSLSRNAQHAFSVLGIRCRGGIHLPKQILVQHRFHGTLTDAEEPDAVGNDRIFGKALKIRIHILLPHGPELSGRSGKKDHDLLGNSRRTYLSSRHLFLRACCGSQTFTKGIRYRTYPVLFRRAFLYRGSDRSLHITKFHTFRDLTGRCFNDHAGRRAVVIGHFETSLRKHRLLKVVGGHADRVVAEILPDHLQGWSVQAKLPAEMRGHDLLGQIVIGRSETACGDHEVAPPDGVRDRPLQPGRIVSYNCVVKDIDAFLRKLL